MTVLATLERTVKAGLSVWEFCDEDGMYYARNNRGKRVPCSDVEDLRIFYKKMLGYGFVVPSDISSAA